MIKGALSSLKVVEFTGLGPAPLAGQLLADLGADVVTIDRKARDADPSDVNRRGKRSVVLDLKTDFGTEAARRLIRQSDILIEGFRPGVMERLGLGPEECADNLIYARMTGWGQTGPWADVAGHDINYLALTGALYAMGKDGEPPVPPLNLVADFGGGTMFLIFGILAAVIERGISGKGQVVDAAMVDGVPAMMGLIHGLLAKGDWTQDRASNWFDGGAPFYRCYTCADGKFISVGALEPQFYALLLTGLSLPAETAEQQYDKSNWPARMDQFAAVFATRTRDEWAEHFAGSDACVAPVLTFAEAPSHPHMQERKTFCTPGGIAQSSVAPRLSRSLPRHSAEPTAPGADTLNILRSIGFSKEQLPRSGKP